MTEADGFFATTPPMEAQSAQALPAGADWWFEPKWDGLRCLAFRKGDEVRPANVGLTKSGDLVPMARLARALICPPASIRERR